MKNIKWDDKTKLMYARLIEEYIAINGLTIIEGCRDIGINRLVYTRLRNSSIGPKNQHRIENFFNLFIEK